MAYQLPALKIARKQKGYSFAQLEKMTGMSRSTLCRHESFGYSSLTITEIMVLSKALEISTAELLGSVIECDDEQITETEYEMILKYRILPKPIQKAITDLVLLYGEDIE